MATRFTGCVRTVTGHRDGRGGVSGKQNGVRNAAVDTRPHFTEIPLQKAWLGSDMRPIEGADLHG